MPHSLDSSRPIMAPSVASTRGSKRFSTLSTSPSDYASTLNGPSAASTTATFSSDSHALPMSNPNMPVGDPRWHDIKVVQSGLERLEVKRLQQQRYTPSKEKRDDLAQLALSAKVERALGRRMTGQDAVLRVKARPLIVHCDAEKQG